MFLATKLSRAGALANTRELVEAQLTALRTDYLDLYSWHRPFLRGRTAAAARASWRELEALQQEGRIRALGVREALRNPRIAK